MENSKNNIKMEYDECLIKGICSISPLLSSSQGAIIMYLGVLCFYMSKLYDMGVENEVIKRDILNVCYDLIMNIEFVKYDLSYTLSRLNNDIYQAKNVYRKVCRDKDIKQEILKLPFRITENFSFSSALRHGQQYFNKKNETLSAERRELYDIFLTILKSIVLYFSELESLGQNINKSFNALVYALGLINVNNFSTDEILNLIDEYTKLDHELLIKTFEVRKESFGNFQKTEILTSHIKGKSILVTGTDLSDLKKILDATIDKGINIYTHGHMIIAHAMPEFQKYKHLIGTFGKGMENYKADFTNFPGPVFLTKLSLLNVQNLFRSNLFTTDCIAPQGVSKIKKYDFGPLISNALNSDGFVENATKKVFCLDFDENEFLQKIKEKSELIKNGQIKHILIIGVKNRASDQAEYFNQIMKLIDESFLIITFSYYTAHKNIIVADFDYAFPLLYEALLEISKIKSFDEIDVNILFARCEPHTIPNLFYLKNIGLKNIFFCNCSPNLINPAIVSSVVKRLKLNLYSSPQEDYRKIIEDSPKDS